MYMVRQKQINNMLNKIRNSTPVYSTYGSIVRVMWWHIVAIVDRFIPTMSIPTILAKKYIGHMECFRVTIRK